MKSVVILLLIFVVVFLIVRQFWLWYWKVNAITDKLDAIEKHLAKMSAAVPAPPTPKPAAPVKKTLPPTAPVPVTGSKETTTASNIKS
ncbi:hypothetical protein [Paenibacillus sp. MMO-177]|uniref:hypothetical protein n=1 Tax=Paenibacillus sp. MMO-177 TaxID=3081289 RepID=UPI00301A40F6